MQKCIDISFWFVMNFSNLKMYLRFRKVYWCASNHSSLGFCWTIFRKMHRSAMNAGKRLVQRTKRENNVQQLWQFGRERQWTNEMIYYAKIKKLQNSSRLWTNRRRVFVAISWWWKKKMRLNVGRHRNQRTDRAYWTDITFMGRS